MNELTDQQLLRDYAGRQFEPAFAELVRRHLNLVYSAALRMVRDPHLAEDVTQGVFAALALNARQLVDRPVLSGWLHRTALNLSAKTVRSEVRRRVREQEAAVMNKLLSAESAESGVAWEQIAPHLDAALGELSEADRDAVLSRYFERRSASQMAQALGVSSEAAQKRVSRAVNRLRDLFAKRGFSVGTSALTVMISANAVQAAPPGLAAALSSAALLAGTSLAATSASATQMIVMTTLQKVLAAGIIGAALATAVFVQQRHQWRMREADSVLRQQSDQIALLRGENERLSGLAKSNGSPNSLENLLALRMEAARLRARTNDLTGLLDENRRLRGAKSKLLADARSSLELKDEAIGKMIFSKGWMLAAMVYANQNQGQLPARLEQVSDYLPANVKEEATSMSDQFEIVYHGSLNALTNVMSVIVLREKQAWQTPHGNWLRAYAFGDGHSEIHSSPDGRFDAWEKEHSPNSTRP